MHAGAQREGSLQGPGCAQGRAGIRPGAARWVQGNLNCSAASQHRFLGGIRLRLPVPFSKLMNKVQMSYVPRNGHFRGLTASSKRGTQMGCNRHRELKETRQLSHNAALIT